MRIGLHLLESTCHVEGKLLIFYYIIRMCMLSRAFSCCPLNFANQRPKVFSLVLKFRPAGHAAE